MKARLNALLVHGMGNDKSWWNPFIDYLKSIDINPLALDMPSLEKGDPELWINEIKKNTDNNAPTILIGHSLGAAASIVAATTHHYEGLILLACPTFFDDFRPQPPINNTHSIMATINVARFLMNIPKASQQISTDSVHFVGEKDIYIPMEQAARLPIPLIKIPSAGHELNKSRKFIQEIIKYIVSSKYGKEYLDPGARLTYFSQYNAEALQINESSPSPARIDMEITTQCQLSCPFCARTLYRDSNKETDMDIKTFNKIICESQNVKELFFVGLGEPLLHPNFDLFVKTATDNQIRTILVTNGILANATTLNHLHNYGLKEVTFSIDSTNPENFSKLKGNASLSIVLENFRSVPKGIRKSIFVTLSQKNISDLIGIIDLAKEEKLPVIAISDLNFEENQKYSLNDTESKQLLNHAIKYACKKNILLISQHLHDINNIEKNFWFCIVKKPEDVINYSNKHKYCLAPWRIAVIDVNGNVLPCNCAVKINVGNINKHTLSDIWNNNQMKNWRKNVLNNSSKLCYYCPRY